jgi:uncharacterized protein with GYD domain
MNTYIFLLNWRQPGIKGIKQAPGRLDEAKKTFKAFGGELKEFYMTMGRFDMVVVAEAPDDATCAKIALTIASVGDVRTETMRAFEEDDYRKIIAALP